MGYIHPTPRESIIVLENARRVTEALCEGWCRGYVQHVHVCCTCAALSWF